LQNEHDHADDRQDREPDLLVFPEGVERVEGHYHSSVSGDP
jgi:hypothetical protein